MEKNNNISSSAKVNNNTILNEGEYIVWTFGDNGDPYNTKKEALAARKEFFGHLYASEAEMDRYIPVHKEIWIRECGLESNIPVCDYEERLSGKQTYELVDNGQFPYGYQYLENSRLREEIADKIKDHLFWGEDCEDDFVVYECDNGDYTFAYTFNWLNNELTYQITNEDGYCESFTDGDYDLGMYDRVDAMMKWLEEHLLEIDRREWEKNNKNNERA